MTTADPTTATVTFTGRRGWLFGMLFGGYLAMLPTLGLYRFWLLTKKRQFYWMNTEIGGDPLEYTGAAWQLLVGFLFALAFFLPVYAAFFYFYTQTSEVALIGYGVVGALFWLVIGYAQYRGRDFRLSRTLWRGIRFDQRGSAWGYAFRRAGWSLLVLVTLGLAYPFMAGDLWRYRYRNSWYGDRQFGFSGSWKTVAWPYYLAWMLAVLPSAAIVVALVFNAGVGGVSPWQLASVSGLFTIPFALAFVYYKSRETSRMLSRVSLGGATVKVRVKMRTLIGQYLAFALMAALSVAGLLLIGAVIFAVVVGRPGSGLDAGNVAQLGSAGLMGVIATVGGYLAIFAATTMMSEIFLGLGFWKAVANGAVVEGLDSLDDVAGRDEDRSLVGEGLADAFNVGGY
ncbi:DUF898 family protein [Devosia sp.]|uniref:DUF898 family protein n=1 Tax=Devosia sp. TaxID=1871048 RepID=UPI003A8D71A7